MPNLRQSFSVHDIPNRSKSSYFGRRTKKSFQIIQDQVYDVAANYATDGGLDFDEDDANWVVLPTYRMPKNWRHGERYNPLLIVFPTEYPSEPPIGFYLPDWVSASPNGHLYPNAYHNAAHEPLNRGWQWYCVFVTPGSWEPAVVKRKSDWRNGDNLWTYMQLIDEALASMD